MAITKNPLQDADGVNPVFQGVTFTEAPAAPAAQAPAPAQPDAPSATTKPAPTMPTTDEAINRPIIESAYQKAQREYIEGLNRNQPDEAKIREEERVRQQARIDSINQFYNEELNRARKQGEGRLGETRALGAARGVLGSEFGIAEKQGTIDQNNAQERAINAERQVKIDEVFRSIDDAVYKKVEAERTRADKNSKEYLDFLKGTQDEARESVKTLATSGLKSLADLGEERLKKLLEGTGYSQIEAESIFNANKKKEEKVKYTYQELKNGSLLRLGDDGTSTVIKDADPIQEGWELKELNDGTLVQFNPKTNELKMYGEQGQFAKPDSVESDVLTQEEINDQALRYAENYGVSFEEAKAAIRGTGSTSQNPSGTNRPTRNNNPLNIKLGGATQKWVASGASLDPSPASDGGQFLVFKTPEEGFKAAEDLLFNSGVYKGLTVDQALRKWSNNGYGAEASSVGNKSIDQLTPEQRSQLIKDMAKREGYVQTAVGQYQEPKTDSKFTPEFYATKRGQQVADDERTAKQRFEQYPVVKTFVEAQDKYLGMKSIVESGTGGPQDVAIVYEFMKALDPSSVVRETEFSSAASSGNIFSGALAKFNGYFSPEGGVLPADVKKEFMGIIAKKLDAKAKQYNQYVDENRRIAQQQGLNPDNVATKFELDLPELKTYKVKAPDGTEFEFDTQAQLDQFKAEAGL